MQIKDIFNEKQFKIVRIKYEYNSPNKDIIVRINSKEYEVKYFILKKFLNTLNINLDRELLTNHISTEKLDNRPLYKKALDVQLGRKVNFNNQKHYISIGYDFLERTLGDLYEKNFNRSNDGKS